MVILGGLFLAIGMIIGLICGITVIIDAFKNEVWKGLLYLFCAPYALYYLFVEFQHENKVMIIVGGLLGPIVGYILFLVFGGASMFHSMAVVH